MHIDGNYDQCDAIVCDSKQTCNSLNVICFDIIAVLFYFYFYNCIGIKHWWDCCGCNMVRFGIHRLNWLIWTQLWKTRRTSIYTPKKWDALSITGARCTSISRRWIAVIDYNQFVCSFVLVGNLLIRSFIYLFIVQMKTKIAQPEQRERAEQQQLVERKKRTWFYGIK